jgi:hypothetical protein
MSGEIKFSCLACGQHIVCDAGESGRPMLCPACNANLTVPHQIDEEPAPPATAPETLESSAKPPRLCESEAAGRRATSALAIASLVCSITCVGWLAGIICGHLAKARIRRDPRLKGRGLATTGLIISYATLVFGTGLAAATVLWWAAQFKEAYRLAEQETATNSLVAAQDQTESQTGSHSDEPTQVPAAGSGWTMDVKDAPIPDSPVSGQIRGQSFELRKAIWHGSFLKFTSANGAEYVIIRGLGQRIANSDIEVEHDSSSDSPKVEIAWGENGQNNTQRFDAGYAMELKFDAVKRRRIHGHIYLCLPDDSKSYIAGAFTVVLPKPKPQQ